MIVRRVNDRNGNCTCELVEVADCHLDERGIGSMVVSLESYETTFRATNILYNPIFFIRYSTLLKMSLHNRAFSQVSASCLLLNLTILPEKLTKACCILTMSVTLLARRSYIWKFLFA